VVPSDFLPVRPGRSGILMSFGTTPMNPAVLVPTPAMGRAVGCTSST
jgi:hypothetical protein